MPHVPWNLSIIYLPAFLCLPACPALGHLMNASMCSPLCCQVTPGGSAARAGLQMGDAVLEVNGYPVGGDNDLNRLQQLTEAEPPLCLKLAARSQQDLEAWISSESGKVKSKTDGTMRRADRRVAG